MSRRHDPRRLKAHLTYSADELAQAMDVNLRTVRTWTKNGLEPIDRKRPFLFAAADVRAYLEAHAQPRQPLEVDEIYCVACKVPRTPVKGSVTYVSLDEASSGDLVGMCPVCHHEIRRRTKRGYAIENPPDLK